MRIMVEIRVDPATADMTAEARSMLSGKVRLDMHYPPVPMAPSSDDSPQHMLDGVDVLVRGELVAGVTLTEVAAIKGVTAVWTDAPIEPFHLADGSDEL